MKTFIALLALAALATTPLLAADNLNDSTITQATASKLPAKVRATNIGNAVFVPHTTTAAKRASGFDTHVPAANTAAIITYAAAGSGISHVITGVAYSYTASPTGGRLTILDGAARNTADCITATDTSLTSATMAFTANDVGSTVSGTGITVGTKIASVTSATVAVLDRVTTASATVTGTLTPIVLDYDIGVAAPFTGVINFDPPKSFKPNTVLTTTLAAPGGAVVGKLTILNHYTEQQ